MLRLVSGALVALACAVPSAPSASASPVCAAAEADTTVTGPVSYLRCVAYPGAVTCATYTVYSGAERVEVVVCLPRVL